MKISAITTEQFVEIYALLRDKAEHCPNSTTMAYTGLLPGTGNVLITSEPAQCLFFRL